MLPRWRPIWLISLAVLSSVVCDDTPPGLVTKNSEQDLEAEASNTAPQQAQKREATLSNSYGEPLPSDAYGPPSHIPIVPDLQSPAPVYGVPDFQNNQINTPPGAYGPPTPIVFPSQVYEGPPPPVGKPKHQYGPPKLHGPPKYNYGPPKPIYGPPKKNYGPPKQVLPKPIYGAPFKPQKINFPKPVYGSPKPVYGPPKPVYGPPKQTYGAPINPAIPLQDLQPISLPPVSVHSDFGFGNFGGNLGNLGHIEGGISNDIDLGLNLPAPIYGTPINNVHIGSKPNFPIPSDTYGPPGHSLGPVGPNDQVLVEGFSNVGHYGPPQPDPNPRPPHPGIPAPPTPPHVLYDGWKPIPGVSKPLVEHHVGHHVEHHEEHHLEHHVKHHAEQNIGDQYGPPPPPPPPQFQEIHLNLEGNSLPSAGQAQQFSGAQISTGYASVHQDALADIDLNAIVGGDSNHIDQSKTVFEAHYTENLGGHDNRHQQEVSIIQSAPSGQGKPFDTYGAPPVESLSNGPYPASIRQQSSKVLIPPSGIYGVPPGSKYGAPPRPPPPHLPIPYGSFSGGGHTGGQTPRHPIKFRESVPEGLIQQIGHSTHHKDVHGSEHLQQGPAYLPPPIRDVKHISHQTGNHGVGLSLSIEPSNLYSLPHSGNPINFQQQQQPSNLYGSPVDSYSVPLFTVGDHTGSASNINEVKATLDSSFFANLSNADAAAILKHCPYHEAILKAAQLGEKIPAELASSYIASLSSLGSALSKNQQVLISPQNSFNTPVPGSDSVSYNTKDLSSASHTLVQTIVPNNEIKTDKTEKNSVQRGKALKDDSGKHGFKQENLQYVSDQIQQTSEKITKLSEETKKLQQKIVSTSQNINQVSGQLSQYSEIPITGNFGSYSVQIQSADGSNKGGAPSIPHDQLLSEGLLQSILSAIEQPQQSTNQVKQMPNPHFRQPNFRQTQNSYVGQTSNINFSSVDNGGLILPAGYEPVDRTKEKNVDQDVQASNKDIKHMLSKEITNKHYHHHHRGDIPQTECDLKADNSIRQVIVVPPPSSSGDVQQVNDIDENDVAIYFDDNNQSEEKSETVTEISVATSISENVEKYGDKKEFGDKIDNKNKS